jgi:hypothetical protein
MNARGWKKKSLAVLFMIGVSVIGAPNVLAQSLAQSPGTDRIRCVAECEKTLANARKQANDKEFKEITDCENTAAFQLERLCPRKKDETIGDWRRRCDARYPSIAQAEDQCIADANRTFNKEIIAALKIYEDCLAKCTAQFAPITPSQANELTKALQSFGVPDSQMNDLIEASTAAQTQCSETIDAASSKDVLH